MGMSMAETTLLLLLLVAAGAAGVPTAGGGGGEGAQLLAAGPRGCSSLRALGSAASSECAWPVVGERTLERECGVGRSV
jgi:hypothetical protein